MPAPPTTDTDTTATGTGRRAGLDPDEVVDAAIELVEAGGTDALTMRKLAAELGVTTTTIYWHVGSRDELVTAMIRRLSERQAEVPLEGGTPRERVMSAVRQMWRSHLDHPNMTSLAHQAGATSLLEIDVEIALVRELEAAGLTGDDARDALRGILVCVGGFLVLGLRHPDSVPGELRSQTLWAAVDDPDIDSTTIASLSEPLDIDRLFETTVQAVVDSFLPDTRVPDTR